MLDIDGVDAKATRQFLEDLTLRDADFRVDGFDRVDCGVDIDHMFGSTSPTEQNGSAWTALDNVVVFVIGWRISAIGVLVSSVSAAVAVISAAIQIVMLGFSGLADVITGVVFIIGGIFSGSWSDIWMGMKLMAFGVVDAILGVVLDLTVAIAGVVDALTGLFGEGTHWQQGIRDFGDSPTPSLSPVPVY